MGKSQKQPQSEQRDGIGTLNEFSMHAEIIRHIGIEGDQYEASLDGYVIDILRDDKIIEVQTKNLAKLIPKIKKLRNDHIIEIIHPLQAKKVIIKKDKEGAIISRRTSPKKERIENIFDQMVHAPNLITHENVFLKILLIEAEEIWTDDGEGSWRRKFWSISERHLTKVADEKIFSSNEDFLQLLPRSLPSNFTNQQLAENLKIRRRLAGKITYAMRKMGLIEVVDKAGNAYIFSTI